jgi:hypothetical protein
VSFILKDDNRKATKGLLIQYVPLAYHHDPYFDEFTYGEVNSRARRLRRILEKGDYIFFHTSIRGKRVITSYYVLDRILDSEDAISDASIVRKYKNPHLHRTPDKDDDIVLFGDPIRSKKLERPLPFTKEIAKRLSLDIPFDSNRTDNENISSATRTPRVLNSDDVELLLGEISAFEISGLDPSYLYSTDEVLDIREIDLENLLARNPHIIGSNYELVDRQLETREGRLDLLLRDENDMLIVVEIKLNEIGRGAVNQIKRYMSQVRRDTKSEVKGIIICKGIMPAFEEAAKNLRDISIHFYGWKLSVSAFH